MYISLKFFISSDIFSISDSTERVVSIDFAKLSKCFQNPISLHILLTIPYKTESCDAKLFVAATPISGPHPISKKQSLILANDDVVILTIERILASLFLAAFTACRTSALSPLCEIAITIEWSSMMSWTYWNSLDITHSALILGYFAKTYFPIRAA